MVYKWGGILDSQLECPLGLGCHMPATGCGQPEVWGYILQLYSEVRHYSQHLYSGVGITLWNYTLEWALLSRIIHGVAHFILKL